MPFYIRKSASAGPFRFNLSKSGLGVSAGVKGFRIGTGPRGHYIHAGRGGLYYRSSIPGGGGGKPTDRPRSLQPQPSPRIPAACAEPNVEMIRVSSSNVLEMEDARFTDILGELNAKQNSTSMTAVLGWAGAAIAVLSLITAGVAGFALGLIVIGLAIMVGAWLDSFQRTSVLMYDLEDETSAAYEAVTAAFDAMAACVGKWHVDAGGAVRDIHTWKRNAGAGHIVDKRPTVFDYSLPRVIKSNVTPPAIKSGKETLYFLPDFLLVVESNKVGAVAYDRLSIRAQGSHFIEEGTVPSDTQILFHTWKYPNKNGGPDRRFANNRQIPVCLYESIHITSSNGLNELLQVSRSGVTEPFAASIQRLAVVNGSTAVAAPPEPPAPKLLANELCNPAQEHRSYTSNEIELADAHASANRALGLTAFVIVDNAECLFKPEPNSAVRIIPPYGTEVGVLRDTGSWVLISFCGKEAWSPREHLSPTLRPARPAVNVGVAPEPNSTFSPRGSHNVEYGPRGGRFIRTASGLKRYF